MSRNRLFSGWAVLVITAIVTLFGSNAQAGPGGGTYYANSPAGGASGAALRKFVDKLPGVGLPGCTKSSPPGIGTCNENNLGNYIPVASKITGRPGVPADLPTGNDYYEIGLVEYNQKMHSDLPKKTKLRGYRDLSASFANMSTQYLGPLIIASKDKPVRVKFTNMLPTGNAGKLFIPVDTTLMGAGPGPYSDLAGTTTCSTTMMSPYSNTQTINENCSTNIQYTQNRATIHLHGGNSPWISDGTPHQWITPAGETSVPPSMRKGAAVSNVPDMWFDINGNSVAAGTPAATTDPGAGSMTFLWTNQQSNRLMFYHDHSLGITRLNVYAGEAAGYLITDAVEEDLITRGILPNICPGGGAAVCEYRYGVPLIIQDKTFVPQNIAVQDAKWDTTKWGIPGDLWFPHVYEPNQDPTSPAGANPFGRWDYGPWFWPPVSVDPSKRTIPDPSTTPEAFMDTMVVNGTAYPYMTVEPKPYRFRILNATNDRMLNLSLFIADQNDPLGTEVKMVTAAPTPTFPAGPYPTEAVWPTDGRAGGVPDPATRGPNIIQIGNESGFIANPVVHPNQPVNYNYNRRDIVVLNVQEKNLFLGSAERADVVIDFSDPKYIGKNIILYNDAPAPVPAGDPRQDYYTGNPDQTASGGAPSTLRGYGPNTRTVMQFRVAGTPAPNPTLLSKLNTELPLAFKASQPAPLVPEPTYPTTAWGVATPQEQYAKIQDYSITLKPLNRDYTQSTIPATIPFQSKAIQELWDPYGRMNATLGLELPFTSQFNQTTIPMGYAEPATEMIVDGHPQIWKVTHNGVDTHPVHFHMFDVQVINRVGWDGAIRPADENELGWKETVRMNPLEDIIVALRPKNQTLPATITLPTSTRLVDPTQPVNAMLPATDIGNFVSRGFTINQGVAGAPNAGQAVVILNKSVDYGYEYVWHCHILGHEENDFMRPVIFTASTALPPNPSFTALINAGTNPSVPTPGGAFLFGQQVPGKTGYVNAYNNPNINQIVLQWSDGSPETTPSRFLVQRSVNGGAFADLAEISFLSGWPAIYTDTAVDPGTQYAYNIYALNDYLVSNAKSAAPATSATVTTGAWLPATGVAVTDSKPIGHVVGTNVHFTAAASVTATPQPTNVAYQYRFLVNGVEVQPFGSSNLYTLPDTTAVGSYTITVEARTSASQNPVASTTITHAVINPPNPPTTVASPVPAVYSAEPVVVTLTATAPNPAVPVQGIYYTLDGSLPTTAMPPYVGPITLTKTTTINYFAVDVNGTAEAVHSDTWYIHVPDLVATMQINNGATFAKGLAVTLNVNAFDPVGVATMEFSNDGTNWSGEEPYATTKQWTLTTGSDGPRTVYARFRDKSLPTGVQYPPITAAITLDTTAPITTPSPDPGTYTNGSSLFVSLTASETATIYYTIDGTTPTTASLVYAAPIQINTAAGSSTTIKYFAIDSAGNVETVKTSVWSMATIDLTASAKINGGATWTPITNVTLTLNVSDPSGVASYGLSNDGSTWSGPFASPDTTAGANLTITPSWTLTSGEGLKTVYIRFTDTNLGGGTTYPPITATILLGTKDGLIPGTSSHLASAIKALKIAKGFISPGPLDLVHADVAPYSRGASQPDGRIDLGDVSVILLHLLGVIATF
ncbi:chitobiase/beta-hexosaminidase C-terminal domain-containing protein [Geobacter pelophilus]|uniref:Chitobiase/beta-hexosaminidase C-terminal domain-containing protein n=1 Tax=Geoanaerobacter pelophilus TaxID=60036 RepID=A0AAW4LC11_9BACT|nr:chitobiase/beta-hexosaminidase C-terminal domain-containing protein [Geoanaerobacter pelophilus]MBT0666115.1 chitobiase/beta-hexosaminidase C-terminal domain-containing protein [Geoanaerobacter pelophilus]